MRGSLAITQRYYHRFSPVCQTDVHFRPGQLWRYQSSRADAKPTAYLFVVRHERPLDRCVLGRLLKRIGDRAGVLNVHPHRFRHTFAIAFLRNGGNVYALQRMLGHSSLDMVKRYLSIAQADVQDAHRDASPVTNWCL